MKAWRELKAKSFRANEEIIQNTGDEKELLYVNMLRKDMHAHDHTHTFVIIRKCKEQN